MWTQDLHEGRRHHAALHEIFMDHLGGRDDPVTLRRVEELCAAGMLAVDDSYCWDKLALVRQYAAEIFSNDRHRKWDRGAIPGAEFLRLMILMALDSFHNRLYSLEALRRAGTPEQPRRAEQPEPSGGNPPRSGH